MERGRGGRDDFFGFGDPFPGFGVGRSGSLIASLFGGRDPFDDPFFNRPFGSLMGPSIFGGPSVFAPGRSMFGETADARFLEEAPLPARSGGPVIREVSDDDEDKEDVAEEDTNEGERRHGRSGGQPIVQEPDEETQEMKNPHVQYGGGEFSRASVAQPQARTCTFRSSTVTYGGPNGAYYTSSTTRRTGGDGITVEESKEADATSGRAAHRISRGIHDKGHSVTRRLGSDGRVDTTQTLHNLNEDELAGFEETWRGNARQHFPGWNPGFGMLDSGSSTLNFVGWATS
ncbi:hypothetical protein ACMD2_13276 [Ananas comosus]|uniref:Myeloid leukemia factor 1 n=1 Tax=Ananas comosus TaxID=4615 RepID=A0A199VMK2_ANACO|nr:hypothetical protein ACMD2_13276 [Ananas comosus]